MNSYLCNLCFALRIQNDLEWEGKPENPKYIGIQKYKLSWTTRNVT